MLDGLVVVYTGGGKGKTTAALGLALRALGYGKRVRMIQFIKGSWHYGEMSSSARLEPEFELMAVGRGFVGIMDDTSSIQQHRDTAAQAVRLARDSMGSGRYDVVILDEVNYAISMGLVDEDDILEMVRRRPPGVDVVLTGNHASDRMMDVADLVTEMREIKHPFRRGIRARKGIDY